MSEGRSLGRGFHERGSPGDLLVRQVSLCVSLILELSQSEVVIFAHYAHFGEVFGIMFSSDGVIGWATRIDRYARMLGLRMASMISQCKIDDEGNATERCHNQSDFSSFHHVS